MSVYETRRPQRRLGAATRAVFAALLVSSVMLALAAPAFAAEMTLTSTGDTFITNAGPDTNYDAEGYTGLGTVVLDKYRTLLRFNLTGITGRITGARLRVFYYDGFGFPAGRVEVYRLKRAWTESQATWNECFPGSAWSTPGAMGADDIAPTPLARVTPPSGYPSWLELELDPVEVEKLRNGTYSNTGFLLRGDWEDDPDYLTHLYRGRTDVNGPELVVTYDESAPPVVSTPASSMWSLTLAAVMGIGGIAAFGRARRLAADEEGVAVR